MGIEEEAADGKEKRRKEMVSLGPKFVELRKEVHFSLDTTLADEDHGLDTKIGRILYSDKDLPEPPFKLSDKKKY